MKQEDFDRLKSVCKKEGFDITMFNPHDTTFAITKKDIWDGVEFYSDQLGIIRKMTDDVLKVIKGGVKLLLQPSTEQAYVEQLKAEAFKRFGEIKEGDRFDQSPFNSMAGVFSLDKPYNVNGRDFSYDKESDTWYLKGCAIYEKGKWAKKLPERVKVEFFNDSLDEHEQIEEWGYVFKIHNAEYGNRKSLDSGEFLASKLEEYLNKP